MKIFTQKDLGTLWKPENDSDGEDNGQVTVIGGSSLFHGAPLFSLTAASRMADMVFFASPDPSVGEVAAQLKSRLFSFIWVPWEDTEKYIEKSDAILIGPGFMRYESENSEHKHNMEVCDEACRKTKEITKNFLTKYPDKKWVIDAGSLQTMETEWIPRNAILTTNKKEFQHLFGVSFPSFNIKEIEMTVSIMARRHNCVIVYKAPDSIVSDGKESYLIQGGNAGLTKGGTGDTLAGTTLGYLAKNPPLLAAAAGSFVLKRAADDLYSVFGTKYNADDLAIAIAKETH